MAPRMFITGATGYIGSKTTEFAIAQGYEVYGLSRSDPGDTKLRALGATPVRGDLVSFDVITPNSAEADVVLHLADALASDFNMDYKEVLQIDAGAIKAMEEGLKGTDKLLVITSGTLIVKSDPDGAETTEASPSQKDIPIQRYISEQNALSLNQKGIRTCAVRLAPFVYGRGASGVRLFMEMFFSGGQVSYVGDGPAKTSVVHVVDAARIYLLVASKAKGGEIFNVTPSTDVTIRQLAEAMASTLSLSAVSQTFEEMAAEFGGLAAKFFSSENRASSAKARAELGWAPKEIGILEDIKSGSYREVAQDFKKITAS